MIRRIEMNQHIKKNTHKGFTLVEVLTAAIIIGVLISIALPNYARSVERAKGAQAIQVLTEMRTAALSYFNEIDHSNQTQNTFTGLDIGLLELQTGANFNSSGENPDWTYAITTNTATRLVLQATRLGGPHVAAGNATITLTDDITNNTQAQWSDPDSDYPWDDPGVW